MWRELGTFENAQAITAEKAVFNAVVILHLRPLPAAETIRRALDILQKRHPLLRARITRFHRRRWFAERECDIPMRIVAAGPAEAWKNEAERELNTPFNPEVSPLVRAVLVQRENEGEVIFCFHHAIVDADSGVHLMGEFLETCSNSQPSGTPLPDFPLPLPAAQLNFPSRHRSLRGFLSLTGFFFRSLADEISFHITGGAGKPPPADGSGRVIQFTMDADLSRSILRHCRKTGISFNSLAAAAMLMVVHRELYQSRPHRLRHITFANLRPYLSPEHDPRRLGSNFSMLRLTIPMKRTNTLPELARILQQRIQRSVGKGDKFNTARMSKTMMTALFKMRRFRMSSTALSYSGPLLLPADFGDLHLRQIHVFVSNFPLGPEFTAQVRLFNGRLTWDILYLDCDMTAETAIHIAGKIKDLLTRFRDEDN